MSTRALEYAVATPSRMAANAVAVALADRLTSVTEATIDTVPPVTVEPAPMVMPRCTW